MGNACTSRKAISISLGSPVGTASIPRSATNETMDSDAESTTSKKKVRFDLAKNEERIFVEFVECADRMEADYHDMNRVAYSRQNSGLSMEKSCCCADSYSDSSSDQEENTTFAKGEDSHSWNLSSLHVTKEQETNITKKNKKPKPIIKRYKVVQLTWSKQYLLGILMIDRQHKRLVNLLFDLCKVKDQFIKDNNSISFEKRVDRVLKELLKYTRIHFREEESLMAKYDYPLLKPHKRVHLDFEQRIERTRAQFPGGKISIVVVENMSSFLRDWLVSHILNIDKRLVDFLVETDPGLKNDYNFHV